MNKLKSNTGGWPLELEDLDFNDAAIREAFYGLLSAFGIDPQDSFILSGCDQSGANYNGGYISLNGEILKVVGDTIPILAGLEVLYWDFDVTYDTAGREQFENGSTIDTYEVRRGILKKGTPSVGTYMPFAAPTIFEVMGDKMADVFVLKSKVIKDFQSATGVAINTSAADVIAQFIPDQNQSCTKMTFTFNAQFTPSNSSVFDITFRIKLNGSTIHEQTVSSISTVGGARNITLMWVGSYSANQPVQVEAQCGALSMTVNKAQIVCEGIAD